MNSTERDVRRALTEGLRPHTCAGCGTTVLVKKNSLAHTSVQWTSDPAQRCAEFAAAEGVLPWCAQLRASIEAAVLDGTIPYA